MADEGNGSSNRRMDLNLYLGPPRSPRPRSLDLGSDLALSSVPLPRLYPAAGEESRSASFMPLLESSDSHTPFSPSPHYSFPPDPPPASPLLPSMPSSDELAQDYAPYRPFPPPFPFGPDISFLRSYAELLPPVEDSDEIVAGDDNRSDVPYNPVPPPDLADESLAAGRDFQMAYSPSYDPVPAIPQSHDEAHFMPDIPVSFSIGGGLNGNGGPSLPQDFIRYPEFRFRRLIDSQRGGSQHGYRRQRFRSLPYNDGSFNFGMSSLATDERVVLSDNMSTGRAAETSGKKKLSNDGIVDEPLEEKTKEKSGSAVNFECNVCLDVAKEPVVTSCGHLFCWPCLYQWLHLHSDHKECPVCKGEVSDSNIIPIYGRGNSETREEKEGREDGELGLKIPPRPRGRRFDSLRQQLPRPISRRLGEGITSSLRRIVDEEIHNGNRLEANARPGIIDGASHRIMARWRAHRLSRDGDNLEIASNAWETVPPILNVPALNGPNAQDGNIRLRFWGDDIWNHHSLGFAGADRLERLADMPSDLNLRNFAGIASGSNNGSSPSLSNMQNRGPVVGRPATLPPRAADQASASSTMAVIQGDAGVADVSGEPNSAGSSRVLRRRRNNASSSSDVDGLLHACKRRRLN